jgi:hypothetical protein
VDVLIIIEQHFRTIEKRFGDFSATSSPYVPLGMTGARCA